LDRGAFQWDCHGADFRFPLAAGGEDDARDIRARVRGLPSNDGVFNSRHLVKCSLSPFAGRAILELAHEHRWIGSDKESPVALKAQGLPVVLQTATPGVRWGR